MDLHPNNLRRRRKIAQRSLSRQYAEQWQSRLDNWKCFRPFRRHRRKVRGLYRVEFPNINSQLLFRFTPQTPTYAISSFDSPSSSYLSVLIVQNTLLTILPMRLHFPPVEFVAFVAPPSPKPRQTPAVQEIELDLE